MLKKILLYPIYVLLISLIFFIFLPDINIISDTYTLILGISLLIVIFKNRISNYFPGSFNLGLIYFFALILILLIGNLNYYVVLFVYPKYSDSIIITNIYFMSGIVFFCIGFIANIKQNCYLKIRDEIRISDLKLFILIATSTIAGLIIILTLGFIPTLTGIDERFIAFDNTLIYRFWLLSIFAGLLSIQHFYYSKRNKRYILLFIFSLSITAINNMRVIPFLLIVSVFIFIYFIYGLKKIKYFLPLILVLYLLINVFVLQVRARNEVNNLTGVERSSSLNTIQKVYLYRTFNEYRQLNQMINKYNDNFYYGLTLINIPLGFIPAFFADPILSIFNSSKNKLSELNVALITQELTNASSGIRTGIMGEFYLNFGLFGGIFMYFIGSLIAFLQKKIIACEKTDIRLSLYIILFSVLLYALIGQINAIGSLFAFFYLVLLLINISASK